jgi:hypothetical protein
MPCGRLPWMTNLAPFPPMKSVARSSPSDSNSDKATDAILTLLARLTPDEQEDVLKKLTELLRPISAPRAGGVLDAIIRLLPQRRDWTVEDLKAGVGSRGVEATPKEIYNALGYLTRKGHIRRVGYGQYIVDGVAVLTTEELGGEPTRHEQYGAD